MNTHEIFFTDTAANPVPLFSCALELGQELGQQIEAVIFILDFTNRIEFSDMLASIGFGCNACIPLIYCDLLLNSAAVNIGHLDIKITLLGDNLGLPANHSLIVVRVSRQEESR